MGPGTGLIDWPGVAARYETLPWLLVDFVPEIDSPRLRNLLALWQAKCGAATLPSRTAFDPLQMREHLGWLSLARVEPDRRDLRYRLIGTKVVDWHGRDITGHLASAALPQPLPGLLMLLVEHPRVARLHGQISWRDKGHLSYEMLVLPLAEDGATVDQLLFGWSIPEPETAP